MRFGFSTYPPTSTQQDIEKLAPKRGVVLQSVKDTLQSLVDDDLVVGEKIGASNFYWAFPGAAAAAAAADVAKLEAALAAATTTEADLQAKLAAAAAGGDAATTQRAAARAALAKAEAAVAAARAELDDAAAFDPAKHAALTDARDVAVGAANRWLDNAHALRSWCGRRFEGAGGELDSFFAKAGLGDDVDYLE